MRYPYGSDPYKDTASVGFGSAEVLRSVAEVPDSRDHPSSHELRLYCTPYVTSPSCPVGKHAWQYKTHMTVTQAVTHAVTFIRALTG